MTDANARCRAIIRRALDDLGAMGMDPAGAAMCLATQGIIRVEDADSRRSLLALIADPEDDDLPDDLSAAPH